MLNYQTGIRKNVVYVKEMTLMSFQASIICFMHFVLLSRIWAHRKVESDDYLILTVPLVEGSLVDGNIIFSYLKIAEVFAVLAASSEQNTFVTLR